MWLFGGFWQILRGFWRLLVGLVIGAVLYVWLFFEQKDLWIDIHHKTNGFMEWLASQPLLSEYSQWNMLLHLDDKLTFALFILVGRIIWLMIEAVLFSFPHWLIFGRGAKTTPLGENGIPLAYLDEGAEKIPMVAPRPAVAAPVAPQKPADTGLKATIDSGNVPAVPPEAMAEAKSSGLAGSLDGLQDKAGELERSIDQALERIDQPGDQKDG